MSKKYIPDLLYNKILENMPIICVDIIVIYNKKFLLLNRNNEPEKNKWWLPGGRLLKGEILKDAVMRKLKEETNIDGDIFRRVGITETIFKTGVNNIPTHTINICYKIKIKHKKNLDIKINNDHNKFKWFKNPPKGINKELKKILKNSL